MPIENDRALRLLFLTCTSLLFVTIMEEEPARAAGGDAGKRKTVDEKHCILCHGPQGKGDGRVGQATNPPATDFTSLASKKNTDTEPLTTIEYGRPPTAMEAWKGQPSDSHIQDVLAYVKSLRE